MRRTRFATGLSLHEIEFNGRRGDATYINSMGDVPAKPKWRPSMPNIVTRIALILAVLALPAAAFARGAGGGGLASRGAILGSAMNFNQMQRAAAPSVAPIPPPRITVPAIPQFK
jgi:hypothetical protein